MGNLTKARVREIAAERGFLKAAHKRDSLGVCFCPMDYRTFLHKELPEGSILPGKFFDEMGNLSHGTKVILSIPSASGEDWT